VPEARLADTGSGLAPVSDGWFVVNVRDVEWWVSSTFGSGCTFESREHEMPQERFALVGVLQPPASNPKLNHQYVIRFQSR